MLYLSQRKLRKEKTKLPLSRLCVPPLGHPVCLQPQHHHQDHHEHAHVHAEAHDQGLRQGPVSIGGAVESKFFILQTLHDLPIIMAIKKKKSCPKQEKVFSCTQDEVLN